MLKKPLKSYCDKSLVIEWISIRVYYSYEVIIMSEVANKNKKIQINVNRELAGQAEEIMKEIGLNPTVVINALYKEIVATKKIPLSFSLTSKQIDDFEIRQLAKKRPIHKVKTKKELEEFFDED